MNKKAFRSISRYSLALTLAIIVLTIFAATLSTTKAPTTKVQTLSTDSASSLAVQSATPSDAPMVSSGGSGGASSNSTISLQPAAQATGTGNAGVAYPCDSCPAAPDATDIMVCADYCISPTPEPSPTPNPYPVCDPCHSNTYGTSSKPTMCPMIACRFPEQ